MNNSEWQKQVGLNIQEYLNYEEKERARTRATEIEIKRARKEEKRIRSWQQAEKDMGKERKVVGERGVLPDSLNKPRVILRRLNIIHPSSRRARCPALPWRRRKTKLREKVICARARRRRRKA